MRELSAIYSFGFVIFLLVGCSSTPKSVYKSSHSINLPAQIFLDLSQLKKSRVAMNSGYDGEKISDILDHAKDEAGRSVERVAQQGYSLPAGSDYIVDGVSTAIGFAIIPLMRSIEEKKVQNRKNEPVKELLTRMDSINWSSYANQLIDENLGVPVSLSLPDVNKTDGDILRIYPLLEVTSNYQSLELHSLVELISAKSGVIYSNYFHVQSMPLLEQGKNLSDLNFITEEQIKVKMSDLFKKMLPLIYADLHANEEKTTIREIRFKNHMGRYYARGKLLKRDKETGYITFKTSRGEVKSYPFMNRLLSNTASSAN